MPRVSACGNTVSAGYGPLDVQSFGLGVLDRRGDDVDLLAPEGAAFSGVRVERRDRDVWIGLARLLERVGDQRNRGVDAVAGDEVADGAQRHMRRHARRPQVAQNVDLAAWTVEREALDCEIEFVAGVMTGEAHRLFVERRVNDAVDCATLARIEQEGERVENLATGIRGDAADRCHLGIERTMQEDPRLVRGGGIGEAGDGGERAAGADRCAAALEDCPVAHDDDPHVRRHLSFGHPAGNNLRADAGAIAEEQRQDFRHFVPFLPAERLSYSTRNL